MKIKKYKKSRFRLDELENLDKDKAVHVVLSGGGEKGVAHIAFLEKLESLNIQIHSISASSAGALVGAMYSSGVNLKDILKFFLETPLFQYSWINLRNPGLFKSEKYQALIKDYIPSDFQDLKIPMFVTTTNLEEGTSCYFHSGDLVQPVLASCAVPAMFNPIKIDNQLHCDGGVMDNFPIYPFLGSELPILGSYVSLPKNKETKDLNTILKVTNQSGLLMSHSVERHKFKKTDYTAIFPLGDFSSFDMKLVQPIYNRASDFLKLK